MDYEFDVDDQQRPTACDSLVKFCKRTRVNPCAACSVVLAVEPQRTWLTLELPVVSVVLHESPDVHLNVRQNIVTFHVIDSKAE